MTLRMPGGMLLRIWLHLLFVAPTTFAASLLDRGDRFYDPDTGLEWLKLSYTAGQSYNDVAGGWGSFTTSGGYRFATGVEIRNLFGQLGASGTDAAANLHAGKEALHIFGTTLAMPMSDLYRSWMAYDPTSEPQTPNTHVPVAVFGYGVTRADSPLLSGIFLTPGSLDLRDYRSPEIASALVRSVPEPTICVVLIGGLALLLWQPGKTWRRP